MIIQGLQKLTLLDFPGKVACTVFTAGCNFRCPFCHNAPLVLDTHQNPEIPQEDIFLFLLQREGAPDGVCVTGGEPLIPHAIEAFLAGIKRLGYLVKLDTNGSFPEKLRRIVEEELADYVAMDIKNSREHYGRTIGIEGYDTGNVEQSVAYLMERHVPYEFRTTVVQEYHQRSDFEAIGRWIRGADRYFLQQFQDSGDLIQPGLHAYNENIMRQALDVVKEYVPAAEIRGL